MKFICEGCSNIHNKLNTLVLKGREVPGTGNIFSCCMCKSEICKICGIEKEYDFSSVGLGIESIQLCKDCYKKEMGE